MTVVLRFVEVPAPWRTSNVQRATGT